MFDKGKKKEFEIVREGEDTILRIDYQKIPRVPSLEDDDLCMSQTIELLIKNPSTTKIIFIQKHYYEYDYAQTKLILEIAKIYNALMKNKELFSFQVLNVDANQYSLSERYTQIHTIIFDKLKKDPLGCYVLLQRLLRHENIGLEKEINEKYVKARKTYIDVLQYIISQLDRTKIISIAKPYLPGLKIGKREVYRKIFSPLIRPDFMFTKLMATYPKDAEEIDSYKVGDTEVVIFKLPDTIQFLYHVIPPEFKLDEDQYEILDMARRIMAEHKPEQQDFVNPERMREVFYNVGHDLLEELAAYHNLKVSPEDIEELTQVLIRYTVGFGLIEVLLRDPHVQDITINSPMGTSPMFLVHGKYDECKTNIIPSVTDGESWASKLRLISGRPLDEANPILDTEIEIPGVARARIGVIAPPLNPTGIAYAFRRHRDKPWTLSLFIKYRMINALAAGIISFIVDGNRTMLIAGTRSAGKSSVLGSILVEIMRKYRIITIEDSIHEDSIIDILDNTKHIRLSVKEYFNKYKEQYGFKCKQSREVVILPKHKVLSCNKKGVFEFKKASHIIRHKVKKQLFEISTRTGRRIIVTKDHSLFSLGEKSLLKECKPEQLTIGSRIVVPRKVIVKNKRVSFFSIEKEFYSLNKKDFNKLFVKIRGEIPFSLEKNLDKQTWNRWKKDKVIPLSSWKGSLKKCEKFKFGANSIKLLPTKIKLDEEFLALLGLWLADGCFDKNSTIFSVSSKEEQKLVKNIAKRFGFETKKHSDKFSLMIHSKSFKLLLQKFLGLKGNAYTKRIPSWIFSLSLKQKSAFLRGFYSGDGCCSDREIILSLASMPLLDDIQSLLLHFNIICSINRLREKKSKPNDRTKDSRISELESIKLFKKHVGFLQEYKNKKLSLLATKKSTHQTSGGILLNSTILEELKELCPQRVFNVNDYIKRKNAIGIKKLKQITQFISNKNKSLAKYLLRIVNADIYWDSIVKIRKLPLNIAWVYDFSVPGEENFLANNILAHNTLELPVTSLRNLGYNIQPMKVASALSKGSSEVPADEGIRTTLRLGDSALIVGEVRSTEAKALYESMRVGALANVVAGTIHGDSPYGVYDRVVNDLEVPKTSFKATDIIIVANPIRSADGLHRWRRVTQITEIRKEWENDPMREGGFVDLMKYNATLDELVPTDDLINGDSDILKAIAGNVKEWAGNWDAVWENIELRAKIKGFMVKIAEEFKEDEFLEAPFVIRCNDQFHKISDKIREETGTLDPKRIFFDFEAWIREFAFEEKKKLDREKERLKNGD